MVFDNASIFTSSKFQSYYKQNGIFQKLIDLGHSATNGLAESNVQILKQKLRASNSESNSVRQRVQNILFGYRATPQACGLTNSNPIKCYLSVPP